MRRETELRSGALYPILIKLAGRGWMESRWHHAEEKKLHARAKTLDVRERQEILRLLVKEILVDAESLTIRHCIPSPLQKAVVLLRANLQRSNPRLLPSLKSQVIFCGQGVFTPILAKHTKSFNLV